MNELMVMFSFLLCLIQGVLYRNCSDVINNKPFPLRNASFYNDSCWCCWPPFSKLICFKTIYLILVQIGKQNLLGNGIYCMI